MTGKDLRPELATAYGQAITVSEAVDADQLGLPTPCREMDLAALLDHLVFAARRAAALGFGRTPAIEQTAPHLQLLDDGLGAAVYVCAEASIKPEYRDDAGNPFGPEVEPPVDATSWERLAAFMGRTPR